MSESFERDIIDRLARIETKMDNLESRLQSLENTSHPNYRLNNLAGGGIGAVLTAGLLALLRALGLV